MDTIEQTSGANGKPPSKSGIGPVLGIIIILILLALGSLYYFTKGVEQIQNGADYQAADTETEDEVTAIEATGSSNELDAIEADIEATDFSGLDDSSANVEGELQ